MKKLMTLIALTACAIPAAFADPSVSVSIGIQQPGVYGRIDIGRYPQPAIVSPQPVIIAPTPVAGVRRPIYLYVPAAHQRNWARYCHRYNACGQPVYFVKEQWVRERWQQEHAHGRDHDRGSDRNRHDPRGHDRHDRDHDGRRG